MKLESTFESFDNEDLIATLAAAGVPYGPLQTVGELVELDSHIAYREVLTTTYNHTQEVSVQATNIPFCTASGKESLGSEPPALGEHGEDILSNLSYGPEQRRELHEDGALRLPERNE